MMMMRRLSLGAAIAAALVMAACGGGDSNDDAAANTAGGSGGASGTGADTVAVADVDGIGEILVDSTGMALYSADEEADGQVRCVDGCTSFWEPLTVDGTAPTGAPGVGELGVTERPDGTQQVTADGKLLYTFVQDSAGNVTGDGFADDFGDQHLTWHVVHTGDEATTPPGTAAEGGYPGYGG
jgi:predicted lipoprotein with Yx(FWY)xxD motif